MAQNIKLPHNSQSSRTKKYALLSVSDKTGIVDFAKAIAERGYTIISTGGTAKELEKNGVEVTPIQDITGNPESFDGRMKTVSFHIEGGILYDRDNPKHIEEADNLGVKPIDIVVCNLYPFEQTISKPNVRKEQAIENIDVGGPTMVRAAAKNHKYVLVLVDPNDYHKIAEELKLDAISLDARQALAAKAFAHLSFYDSQIAAYFNTELFPAELTLAGRKVMDLRYGENPHQKSAVYITPHSNSPFGKLTQLWGRGLSLTNITDINAGLESVRVFDEPAAAVIKHNSPCGLALGGTAAEALSRALDADPESAFGGVVVLNRVMDLKTAHIIKTFKEEGRGNMDIIAVPEIEEDALEFLKSVRKTTGIYTFGHIPKQKETDFNLKWIDGGFALQTSDVNHEESFKDWKVVTKKQPTEAQQKQSEIAWKFLTRIKSNTIIVMDPKLPMTRGIGTGQTSRIRSAKIALDQAGDFTEGAILASDSFFPFEDSVTLAVEKGISMIIQQGGSINDKASIEAADKAEIPMIMTGRRAFWH